MDWELQPSQVLRTAASSTFSGGVRDPAESRSSSPTDTKAWARRTAVQTGSAGQSTTPGHAKPSWSMSTPTTGGRSGCTGSQATRLTTRAGSRRLARVDRTPPAAVRLGRLRLLLALDTPAQFDQAVAQLGGALELEVTGGAEHLLLHVLRQAEHFVRRQPGRLLEGRGAKRLLVTMRLHLVHGFDDRQRRDVVLGVVGDLDGAAPVGLGDRLLHRV